jgi:hypothetical protein
MFAPHEYGTPFKQATIIAPLILDATTKNDEMI